MIYKILLIVILTISGYFGVSVKAYAQNNHLVKAQIILPGDSSQSSIDYFSSEERKVKVVTALETAQQIYRDQLDGSTFSLDPSVDVIVAKGYKIDDTKGQNPSDIFSEINGYNLLPNSSEDIVNVVFLANLYSSSVLGESDVNPLSPPYLVNNYNGRFRLAAFNYKVLANILNGSDEQYNDAIHVLVHELGHTFGINYSPFAEAHTCSYYSLGACKPNVFDLSMSIPSAEQGEHDFMSNSLGIPYPELYFSNNPINPEKYQLCQSSFIQPPCADKFPPIDDYPTETKTVLSLIEPAELDISEPQTIKIYGTDLLQNGSGPPKLAIVDPENTKQLIPADESNNFQGHYKILNWSNTSIEIEFLYPTESIGKWRIGIYDSEGDIKYLSKTLSIFDPATLPDYNQVINFQIKTVCSQDENIGVSAPISIYMGNNKENIVGTWQTGDNGFLSAAFTETTKSLYSVEAGPSLNENFQLNSQSYFLLTPENNNITYTYDCTSLPNIQPASTENNRSLSQLIIANNSSFTYPDVSTKNLPDTFLVIDNPQEFRSNFNLTNFDGLIYYRKIYNDGTVEDYQKSASVDQELNIEGTGVILNIYTKTEPEADTETVISSEEPVELFNEPTTDESVE